MSSITLRHDTEIKTRSVLLPNKDGLLLDVFEKEFKELVGHSFPYEKLGYVSRLQLLQSMPEVVAVRRLHSGHILLSGIPEQSTGDLARMISLQKPNEEGYSRKTSQVVQQEKIRLLQLQNDIGVCRFNPSQNLNPDKLKPEVSPLYHRAKLVTEKNSQTRNLVAELVSDEEKKKLRAVLAPFPAGLTLSQYSREYRNFYGHGLRPNLYECEDIAQFCAELPEIFVIGRKESDVYSGDWILHIKKEPAHQQTQITPHPTLANIHQQPQTAPQPTLSKYRAKLVTEKNTQTRNLVAELVSDEEKKKLRAVLAPFPAGLALSQYSREYRNFYGHGLRPSLYECESIAQFCAELPEIFVIGRKESDVYSGDWILHIKKEPAHQQTQMDNIHHQPQTAPQPTLPKNRSSMANIHQQPQTAPQPTLSKHRAKLVTEKNTQIRNLVAELVSDEEKKHRAKLVTEKNTQTRNLVEIWLKEPEHQQTQITPHPTLPKHRSSLDNIHQQPQTAPQPTLPKYRLSLDKIHHQPQTAPHPTLPKRRSSMANIHHQPQTAHQPILPQHPPSLVNIHQQPQTAPQPTLSKHRSSLTNIHVPDKVVANVKLILERYPEGMKKSKFLEVYQHLTGVYLNVKPFGFRKIDDFFHHLHSKGIFQMTNSILTLWSSPCDSKSLMTPKMKSELDVNVVSTSSPSDFVVQPLEHVDSLDRLMTDLREYYDNPANLVFIYSVVTVGEVFALRHHDKLWYRVMVTKMMDATHSLVEFVDYGDTEVVGTGELQPLLERFRELPCLALKAKLAGLKPSHGEWTQEEKLRFRKRVVGRQFVSLIKGAGTSLGRDVLELQLIDTSDPYEDKYISQECGFV